MANTNRYEHWLAPALFVAGFTLVFRGWLFSGFDRIFGDQEDGYIALALIEHWHHVFTGYVHWTDPIFFYPQRGTLGYTDAFFLLGVIYAPLRVVGVDTFTAYMLVMATLAAVGFFGFRRLAIRHFALPPAYAALGAFLFAFGNVDAVKLIHAQCYCAMLVPGLCDLVLLSWGSKRYGGLLGAAAGLLYAALFLTSFQTAWFFGCYLLLLGLLHPAICGLPATQTLISEIAMSKRSTVLAAACGFAVGVLPFLFLYLPVLLGGHSRDFAEVVSNMPDWRDLANVTPENAVWGAALKWLTIAGRSGAVWEVELAFTPVVLAVFLAGVATLALQMRRPTNGLDPYFLLLGAAVIVFWLLQMDYFGMRPWHAVWALIPGGSAIRYPFRSQLVASLFVALVVVFVLARIRGWRSITWILCGILIVEQINVVWPPVFSRSATLAWFNAIPAPPAGCQIFYVVPETTAAGPSGTQQQAAMLFAEIRNIPTVNGFSSWFPDGWALNEPASTGYLLAVRDWAHRKGIEQDLCGLELQSGQWTPGLPH
jgi:hypothetical protein